MMAQFSLTVGQLLTPSHSTALKLSGIFSLSTSFVTMKFSWYWQKQGGKQIRYYLTHWPVTCVWGGAALAKFHKELAMYTVL